MPWSGIKPTTLAYPDDALINWATWPRQNNHTFQLKFSIWFFIKSASPCPLPCFVGSTNSMAKFNWLIIGQAPRRITLGGKDRERPWQEDCPWQGHLSWALLWKSPCASLRNRTPHSQGFLPIPWTQSVLLHRFTLPTFSLQPDSHTHFYLSLAILQGQIQNVSSSMRPSSLSPTYPQLGMILPSSREGLLHMVPLMYHWWLTGLLHDFMAWSKMEMQSSLFRNC